jgi:nucleoside-diphosphate-sugar epimerase
VTWLVTGGAGFLGRHLLRRLAEQDIAARSLDLGPGAPDGVPEIVGDVRDGKAVRDALTDVDVVVHAAAALPVRGNVEETNVVGTQRVARLARERGVARAILVSSAVVYGLEPSPLRETDVPHPIDAYGRSKLRAEEIWLREAPAPLVLRPTAFIGPERLGVFGILFRFVREGRRVYVVGDGSNRYQLLDVEDLVSAILLAGESDAGGILNLGGIVLGTVRDDLEALVRHAGSPSRVVALPALPARLAGRALSAARLSPLSTWHVRSADQDFVLDCSRAGEVLGWAATRSGADALRRAYDWYVAEGRLAAPGLTHRDAWHERGLALLRRLS